jgi:hypothetical protein
MSAFGGKAEMAYCSALLTQSGYLNLAVASFESDQF